VARELISVDQAADEFRLSRGVIFKYLREGRLRRWGRTGDRRTFIDRQELRRLVRPRIKGPR
jgi:hypothetical protein